MIAKQNNYKQIFLERNMDTEHKIRDFVVSEKRGQVAIFIIVAIVIVVSGILIYFLFPNVRTIVSGEIVPNRFLLS